MKATILVLSVCLTLTVARAQYSIDWYKVSGGGGTSTGSVYSLSSTIGQPDAGTMSSAGYSLTGGFWALVAMQTPGSPQLTIVRSSATTATVSWPSSSAGFVLQQNPNLAPANWINCPLPVNDNGTNKWVVISPPVGNMYYRLRK